MGCTSLKGHGYHPDYLSFQPCWIRDNVLVRLEEVDFLESAQDPGCLVFLGFSKAYDRLNRNWADMCMAGLHFGPAACRWVSLLHAGLQCRVRYNGWLHSSFPVNSGLAQGSLSRLCYTSPQRNLLQPIHPSISGRRLGSGISRPSAFLTGPLLPHVISTLTTLPSACALVLTSLPLSKVASNCALPPLDQR